jgi:hypothetical protein
MAGVAFAVEGDGVGFATESYAASALYTTLANLSADLWRIRRARPGAVLQLPLILLTLKFGSWRLISEFLNLRTARPEGHLLQFETLRRRQLKRKLEEQTSPKFLAAPIPTRVAACVAIQSRQLTIGR